MPGGAGFLNHQQYELFPCPEKEFTVRWFMRIVWLGDDSKKNIRDDERKKHRKKHGRVTYLWTFWKRIFVPTKYVLCDHSQTFPWVFLEDELLNSMWIVNRTRGSCQRTFMSYSRLFSLSFRNKHKVKRKPSRDKSGNKHFTDPTRPSPARKKNQTPPGNHDIDFYPTSGRRCTQTFATLLLKNTTPNSPKHLSNSAHIGCHALRRPPKMPKWRPLPGGPHASEPSPGGAWQFHHQPLRSHKSHRLQRSSHPDISEISCLRATQRRFPPKTHGISKVFHPLTTGSPPDLDSKKTTMSFIPPLQHLTSQMSTSSHKEELFFCVWWLHGSTRSLSGRSPFCQR